MYIYIGKKVTLGLSYFRNLILPNQNNNKRDKVGIYWFAEMKKKKDQQYKCIVR